MARVYSTRLVAGRLVAGGSPLTYTAPAGSTVVLRDLEVGVHTAGPALLTMSVVGPPGPLVLLPLPEAVSNPRLLQWTGRVVLAATEVLTIAVIEPYSGFLYADVCLSGYVLA